MSVLAALLTPQGNPVPSPGSPLLGGPQFTTLGVIAAAAIVWTVSQSASGGARTALNWLLFVLLASMVLLNWEKIGPLFFKSSSGG